MAAMRKKPMRFFMLIIICVSLLTFASGCSGGSGRNNAASGRTAEAETSVVGSDDINEPGGTVTLPEDAPPDESDEAIDLGSTGPSSEDADAGNETHDAAAVSGGPTNASGPVKTDGFIFAHNGVEIILGETAARVLGELGPEMDYYEYPSCAFDGDSKMYVYGGFEISTYILDEAGGDRIYSVTLNDDSAATAEGVYIGLHIGEMTAAYGTDREEIPGSYLYMKNGTVLSFAEENEIITAISYYIEDIYE